MDSEMVVDDFVQSNKCGQNTLKSVTTEFISGKMRAAKKLLKFMTIDLLL